MKSIFIFKLVVLRKFYWISLNWMLLKIWFFFLHIFQFEGFKGLSLKILFYLKKIQSSEYFHIFSSTLTDNKHLSVLFIHWVVINIFSCVEKFKIFSSMIDNQSVFKIMPVWYKYYSYFNLNCNLIFRYRNLNNLIELFEKLKH